MTILNGGAEILSQWAFFALLLVFKSPAKPATIALLTASAVGFLALMSHLLVLDFPAGLLQDAVDMPWPFN